MECSLGNGGWGHSPQKQALLKPLCKRNLSSMKGICDSNMKPCRELIKTT